MGGDIDAPVGHFHMQPTRKQAMDDLGVTFPLRRHRWPAARNPAQAATQASTHDYNTAAIAESSQKLNAAMTLSAARWAMPRALPIADMSNGTGGRVETVTGVVSPSADPAAANVPMHPSVSAEVSPERDQDTIAPGRHEALVMLSLEVERFAKSIQIQAHQTRGTRLWAIQQVTDCLQTVWPRARTKIFGSFATGLALPSSDVDLLVCLPTVRNLLPIEEAGILEGHKAIEESCLRQASRRLATQSWLVPDSLKTIEGTKIPIITMRVRVPADHAFDGLPTDIPIDISFEAADNQGLEAVALVRQLVSMFPMLTPLTLFFKQFLHDQHLHRAYTGGLSPYCLLLLITRFLQHPHNHAAATTVATVPSSGGATADSPAGASTGADSRSRGTTTAADSASEDPELLGRLLLDFLHFYGVVFDPREMVIATDLYHVVEGGRGRNDSGGSSVRWRSEVDPLYIEDPLNCENNVGQSVFRILQVQKAFGAASLELEAALLEFDPSSRPATSIHRDTSTDSRSEHCDSTNDAIECDAVTAKEEPGLHGRHQHQQHSRASVLPMLSRILPSAADLMVTAAVSRATADADSSTCA